MKKSHFIPPIYSKNLYTKNRSLYWSWERGVFDMLGLIIVLLCIGAYFHYKQNGGCCHNHAPKSSYRDALDIVRARYARGEINSEEFNERKKALE